MFSLDPTCHPYSSSQSPPLHVSLWQSIFQKGNPLPLHNDCIMNPRRTSNEVEAFHHEISYTNLNIQPFQFPLHL